MASVIINGRQESVIDFKDRGFQYGDGLFETMAYKNGRIIYLDEHLSRLSEGCRRLNIPVIDQSVWLEDIKNLSLEKNAQVIKIMLTRGAGGRGYQYGDVEPNRIVACYDWPEYPDNFKNEGVRTRFCKTAVSVNPALAGIKHLNRLDNVLARNEWSDASISEGLMLDDMAYVVEGTMTNVFGVKNGTIYTPDLSRAGVNGIIRNKVIKLARYLGYVVYETNITREELMAMDEIFLTNSIIGIWPVRQVEEKNYNNNLVTQRLIQELNSDENGYEI